MALNKMRKKHVRWNLPTKKIRMKDKSISLSSTQVIRESFFLFSFSSHPRNVASTIPAVPTKLSLSLSLNAVANLVASFTRSAVWVSSLNSRSIAAHFLFLAQDLCTHLRKSSIIAIFMC